jgi:hypothetical protein
MKNGLPGTGANRWRRMPCRHEVRAWGGPSREVVSRLAAVAQSEGPARKHCRPRAMPEPRNAQGTAEPVPRVGVFTVLTSRLLKGSRAVRGAKLHAQAVRSGGGP